MESLNNWRNSKVFITGATGLLGSHLTRLLIERGAEVTVLKRDSVPKSIFYSRAPGWSLDTKVNIVHGNVEDFRLVERAINEYEIDTVFHLAAQTIVGAANRSPIATFKTNIEGTWNVLDACRLHPSKVRRIVVASSDKAYGNLKGEAYDETFPLLGDHPYDVSKSCTDLISRSYALSYDVPVAITRCGNFFGPGDLNFSRIIPGTIRDVLDNRRPVIRSDGTFIRDYIFVEDGAHAYITLAEQMQERAELRGQAFNFSYGLRLSVRDVVSRVLQVMDRSDLTPEILGHAKNEIPVQCLDSQKAKRELGWSARYGFDEGLAQTVAWYQENFSQK